MDAMGFITRGPILLLRGMLTAKICTVKKCGVFVVFPSQMLNVWHTYLHEGLILMVKDGKWLGKYTTGSPTECLGM